MFYQEEMDNNYLNFISNIKKLKNTRNHKIKNSYGVYHAYKYYRKNKPKDKKYILTESQYFSIIRSINKQLGDLLVGGEDIKLPCNLGKLEIRKYKSSVSIDDESKKIKTNLPIDWSNTLKLWYEDEECFNKKILVRLEEKEMYKIYYNKSTARYNNKIFYEFRINRDLKNKLKQNIKSGVIDAFNINKYKL